MCVNKAPANVSKYDEHAFNLNYDSRCTKRQKRTQNVTNEQFCPPTDVDITNKFNISVHFTVRIINTYFTIFT